MKSLSKTASLLFIYISLASSIQGQFISLDGKEFKLNGTNFYPLVMNYSVWICHNPSTLNYYATPAATYGISEAYECNSVATCNSSFQTDFAKIVAMGFNTIRIGLGPTYHEGQIPGSRVFSMLYDDNPGSHSQYRNLSAPNFNDQSSIDFFNIIKNVLDQANAAGLKVILITGRKGPRNSLNIPIYNFVYDQQAVDDYSNYLAKLSTQLANHPALLAYDLFNEPIYGDMYYGFPNGIRTAWKKQDICAFERQWYDAIKPANDPNHLITIGGASTDEVFFWDMGNLKLDFYSVHTYPGNNPFRYPTNIQASIQEGIARNRVIMYWMSQVSHTPWIVGETGFSADDFTNDPIHLNGDPSHHLPPFMFGNEAQQLQFAQQSLDDARNAGSSGYSWWTFQNVHWYSYNPASCPDWPNCLSENYFGLLHYGEGIPYRDKPAVSAFQGYLNNGQPPAIVTLQQPTNYYDPYNIKASLNASSTNSVSGYIYDDQGNPIKDAVIYGTNWLNTIPDEYSTTGPTPTLNDDKFVHQLQFTFSHPDGSFEVVPYNYLQPNIANPHRIVGIQFTSVGAERGNIDAAVQYAHGTDQQLSPSNLGTITLEKVTTGYDAIASNETVYIGETRNYFGWNSLTVDDLTLRGTSNLTARNEVNINSEFIARTGSLVHIYLSDGYSACDDFTGFARLENPNLPNPEMEQDSDKEIELNFIDPKWLNAQIFPNPNNGLFTISIQNPENGIVSLRLKNLLGETLWSTQTNNPELFASFDFLTKGIYLLQINNQNQAVTKKIIIH